MRSTFSGLNTMVKGLYSNQISQETVGHNISNAGTEGYSRQRVNLAATHAQEQASIYGMVQIGTGVDSKSLTRARDIYADRQYWSENPTMTYYEARAKEYDKLETIFDDSMDQGIEEVLAQFYQSWQTLSTSASDSSARIAALERGKNFADKMHTVTSQLQDQIQANYADIQLNVGKLNEMLEQVVQLNKSISGAEATGGMANDLRDQRDLLVDQISDFVNVDVHEKDDGMYTLVSNGVSLVNGISRLTLEMSEPSENDEYGVIDYSILIKESNIEYQPLNGILRAELDAVAE
ncbi:MAG: flagellar hook-associated protein FlgK, partial [Selenomonadaceae bacterium]|nr:flagellar hook-associated protein FlgK [Selenomonadaceae bacterium]